MLDSSRKYFVAVAGNIGTGKSTLTGLLGDAFSWEPFYEANAENPYLADFYRDMRHWSFHSQVFFLGKRLEHHRQLLDSPNSVIQDRTVYEDAEVFARNLFEQGLMSERDYDAYRRLYQAISAFVPPPNLILYLRASVDTLVKRIAERGRDYERDITPAYLEQLNQLYDQWMDCWRACPVICVPIDEIDFRYKPDYLDSLKRDIEAALSEHDPTRA